jgi:hypothetical protein
MAQIVTEIIASSEFCQQEIIADSAKNKLPICWVCCFDVVYSVVLC